MKLEWPIALLFLATACPAVAHQVEYVSTVICDTQTQAERLATLSNDNERAALAAVNAEVHDPTACSVLNVAFVRGASLATARSKSEAFAVIEILVVGVDVGNGYQSIAPGTYFMLAKLDELSA